MPDNNNHIDKPGETTSFIKFKIDRPLRMFVGQIERDKVKIISTDELEGFKEGDKVVVMHSEDWLWFTNELLKTPNES
ncbi:MAG TPA: hypothetical protein VMC48_06570 [Methanobacterium sp.]|nr:hypothetical protein [Methanobacterium sp.]